MINEKKVIMSFYRFCIPFFGFRHDQTRKTFSPMHTLKKQNQNEDELMTLDWCKPLFKQNLHR